MFRIVSCYKWYSG